MNTNYGIHKKKIIREIVKLGLLENSENWIFNKF